MTQEDCKFETENISPNVPLKSVVFKISAECQLLQQKNLNLYHWEIHEQLMLADNVNQATKYYTKEKESLEKKEGVFNIIDSPMNELSHETCIFIDNKKYTKNIIQCTQYSVLTMPAYNVCTQKQF